MVLVCGQAYSLSSTAFYRTTWDLNSSRKWDGTLAQVSESLNKVRVRGGAGSQQLNSRWVVEYML